MTRSMNNPSKYVAHYIPKKEGKTIKDLRQSTIPSNLKETISKVIRLMRKYRIYHRGYIMIGMWGDDANTVWDTYNFAVTRLGLRDLGIGITIPYPNTPFYRILKSRGYIKNLTIENVKWIYKEVYGYDFIAGKVEKPYWRIGDNFNFDDLVKIYRKMMEWEWYQDVKVARVFIHLLLKANHKEKKWKGRTIKKGQVLIGRRQLAKETKGPLSRTTISKSSLNLRSLAAAEAPPATPPTIITFSIANSSHLFLVV